MKVIVAGSRDITDIREVLKAMIDSGFKFTEIVSGHARGVDRLGEQIAAIKGWPVTIFEPDWDGYAQKRAGKVRNVKMAEYVGPAGGLVAVWDGRSKGTGHMITVATERGLRVFWRRVVTPADSHR